MTLSVCRTAGTATGGPAAQTRTRTQNVKTRRRNLARKVPLTKPRLILNGCRRHFNLLSEAAAARRARVTRATPISPDTCLGLHQLFAYPEQRLTQHIAAGAARW